MSAAVSCIARRSDDDGSASSRAYCRCALDPRRTRDDPRRARLVQGNVAGAAQVAAAIGAGSSGQAGWPPRPVPGRRRRRGDARGAAARARRRARRRRRSSDPLGREIEAPFALVEGGGTAAAIVEMAAASGLALVAEGERDAFAASTYGTGELIAAAVEPGAEVVFVGVGGSATTDGGAGAIEAIEEAGGLRERQARRAVRRAHAVRGRGRGLRAAEGRRPGRRSRG